MGSGAHASLIVTAAIAAMAAATPVRALEVEDFFGVWGDRDSGYDCKGEPGSEIMPVSIGRDEAGEISLGAYAWLCSAKDWQPRGPFLSAQASCGQEGDGEITAEQVEVAITGTGRLVLVRGLSIDVLTRCPDNG